MTIEAINPATGAIIARYEPMETQAIARVVDEVHRAFVEWRAASFRDACAADAQGRDDSP